MATVTIDSATYTVYVSESDAVDYANGSPYGAAFVAAVSDDRARYLIGATRRLNAEDWLSTKVSSAQDLAWPRTNINGGVTPQAILDACVELAMLLANGIDIRTSQSAAGQIEKIKAGSVEIQYFFPTAQLTEYLKQVQDLIKPYLSSVSLGTTFSWGVGRESISPTDYTFVERC